MKDIQDKIQQINDSRDLKIGKLYTRYVWGLLHINEFEVRAKKIASDAYTLISPLLELQRGYSNFDADITHFLNKKV